LNQKIIVQPQVGNSVALAAGIIATPIAGAAVWVANQLLGNTVLKKAGFVYRVQGSWQKPTVNQEQGQNKDGSPKQPTTQSQSNGSK
jgi:uncharacterized protein YhdP